MHRIRSYTAVALLSALVAVPLALAQGSTSSTTPATPAAPAKSSSSSSAHHSSSKSKTATPTVDLNSATREQLMKLPGINEATATKIIAARPFKAKDELVSKNLLTKKEYNGIASHVTAKQEHMAGTTK